MKTKHQKKVKKFNDILKAKNIGIDIQTGDNYDANFFLNSPISNNNIKDIPKKDSDIFEEYVVNPISTEELSKKYFAYQMRIILHSSIVNLPQTEHRKKIDTQRNTHANRFSELESSSFQKDLSSSSRKNRRSIKVLHDPISPNAYFRKNNSFLASDDDS